MLWLHPYLLCTHCGVSMHHVRCTMRCALHVMQHAPFGKHALTTIHHATCTISAPCSVHQSPCLMHHSTCTLHHALCTMPHAPCSAVNKCSCLEGLDWKLELQQVGLTSAQSNTLSASSRHSLLTGLVQCCRWCKAPSGIWPTRSLNICIS